MWQSSAGAPGDLLPVLRVPHIPAERAQLVAQFITFLPFFCKPCPLPFFGELDNFSRQPLRLRLKIEGSINSLPPFEPGVGRSRVHLAMVHRPIRIPNCLEQGPKRAGDVEIVVECRLELIPFW